MNGMMRALAISYLRSKLRRSVVTLLGVALGVMMVAAVALSTAAISSNYRSILQGSAGRASLQVALAGTQGFDEAIRDEVAGVEGVRVAVPAVVSGAPVQAGERRASASLYGIDLRVDSLIREYRLTAGRLPQAAGEAAVTTELATLLNVRPGDSMRILTTTGLQDFAVSGVFRGEGAAGGTLGPFGVLPLDQAQQMFGKQGKLDTIDILLADGADRAVVKDRLTALLNGRARVSTPVERARDTDKMLTSVLFGLALAGSISLFAGSFIIYTNVAMGVAERRRELSVLRALGMRRREVISLVLGEAALLGFAGAVLGFLLGYGFASAMVQQVTKQFLEVYGVAAAPVALSAGPVLLCLFVGVAVSTFAAFGPARATVAISPVEAMRSGESASGAEPPGRLQTLAGLALTVAGLSACVLLVRLADLTNGAVKNLLGVLLFVMLLGMALLLPALLPRLTRAFFRPVLERLLGVSGRLSAENLLRRPRRAGATAAALMVSITFMVGLSAYKASQFNTIRDWFNRTVGWDLNISSSYTFTGAQVEMDPALVQQIADVPGIALAAPQKFGRIALSDGDATFLQVFDHTLLPRYSLPPLVDGDWKTAGPLLEQGGAALISPPVVDRLGIGMGGMLLLPTPSGPRAFRVAGILKEVAPFGGTVQLERRDYVQYWKDLTATTVAVQLTPGADPAEVRQRILAQLPDAHLTVQSRADFNADLERQIGGFYQLMDGLIWIATLVAGLAIANTLMAGLLERRREFGMLRAVGARRGELARLVLGEAAGTGIVGALAGLFAGLILYGLMVASSQELTGIQVDAVVPWAALLSGLLVALVIAPLAGALPARWAGRMDIVEALRYE